MQDLIINAIYDLIKDKNLYNYSNNEEFKKSRSWQNDKPIKWTSNTNKNRQGILYN